MKSTIENKLKAKIYLSLNLRNRNTLKLKSKISRPVNFSPKTIYIKIGIFALSPIKGIKCICNNRDI